MKSLLLIAIALSTLVLTGCPSEPSKSLDKNNKNIFANRVNDFLTDEQIKFDNNVNTNPAEAQRIRNDAIEKALAFIDSNYNDYIIKLQNRRSTTDFVADVIELGTGAATGITKGERPNQILGIALTAFRGGRRSAELNFYKEQTTPILISKMDDNRSKVQLAILKHQEQDATKYTMHAAVRDIVNYYNAGTLIRAFTELAKDTSVQAQASEKAVRVLRGDLEVTDIPTLEQTRITGSLFTQRISLERQSDAAVAAADAAEAAIPLPTPVPAAATPEEKQANADAIKTATENRAKARAEKLKPITDKFETILREVVAAPALAPAVADMKNDPEYKAILDKRTATPPVPLTQDDYIDLLTGLTGRIENNAEARNKFLEILSRVNK